MTIDDGLTNDTEGSFRWYLESMPITNQPDIRRILDGIDARDAEIRSLNALVVRNTRREGALRQAILELTDLRFCPKCDALVSPDVIGYYCEECDHYWEPEG